MSYLVRACATEFELLYYWSNILENNKLTVYIISF